MKSNRFRSFAFVGMLAAAQVLSASTVFADELNLAVDPLITMDPAFARGMSQDLSILSQIYSSLTRVDPNGDLVGDLATSWDNVDGKEFTFKLREGVTFADGEPLDASAVVWNIMRLKNPATQATANTDFDLIESIVATDPQTVVVKTSKPFLDLPRRLSWTNFIAPKWSETHNPKVEVNPSGPYVLVDYDFSSHVKLKANEKFYGPKPAYEDVNYRVIANTPTRLAGLRSGELDTSLRIDSVDMESLKTLEGYNVGAIEGPRTLILRFHMGHKAISDVRVRQAINYAIDKKLITSTLYRGLTEPVTTQLLKPKDNGFNPDFTAWPYDPERARQLLAEAGYADGLELRVGTTGEAGYLQAVPSTQAIASQLEAVGIKLKIETIPGASWVTYLRDEEKAPDMVLLAYLSNSGSPSDLLQQFTSAAPYTWGTMPEAYDSAVAQAKSASSPEEQATFLRQATQTMFDEALIVYLWPLPQTYAVSKKVDWKIRSDDWIRASDMRPAQ
jgi:peptide/nickel transport system substrate-binding protein